MTRAPSDPGAASPDGGGRRVALTAVGHRQHGSDHDSEQDEDADHGRDQVQASALGLTTLPVRQLAFQMASGRFAALLVGRHGMSSRGRQRGLREGSVGNG